MTDPYPSLRSPEREKSDKLAQERDGSRQKSSRQKTQAAGVIEFQPMIPISQPVDGKQGLEYFYQQQQINQNQLTMSVGGIKQFYETHIELDPQKSDHPGLSLFLMIMKGIPFLIYFFLGWFTTRTWTIPEVMIVISSVDFWVTKNVAGRRLVGLRWWEEIDDETGKQTWVFESRIDSQQNKSVNEGIFWGTQLAALIGWGLLALINVLTISILNLVGVGFCMTTTLANLYFFIQCSRVQKNRAKQLAQVLGADMVRKMVATSVVWPMRQPHRKGE